jgi:diadenosine tetraphosphate (Ap4A) HIT family hydrolase
MSDLPASPATSDPCPFCEIVHRLNNPETESFPYNERTHIVLSTPDALAFLDRLPLTKGHTLLIPKKHYELLSDIPADEAAELGRVLPLVCRAVMKISNADAFNVVQNNGMYNLCSKLILLGVSAGQVIPHAHFHIVPRYREFSIATMFGNYTLRVR